MIEGTNTTNSDFLQPRLSRDKRVFKNRLGYDVELFDEYGDFHDVVKVPDDTSEVINLYLSEINQLEGELLKHVKRFIIYLLPRYLPKTLSKYSKTLCFFATGLRDGLPLALAIENTLQDEPDQNVNVLKSLICFLILNEYQELPFDKAEEVLKLEGYSSHRNAYFPLFTMDEELGPFTREELRVLNDAVKNEEIVVADRLILALCIQFGLRPIQLSLLKEEDFVEDTELDICYLNIPRVKQKAENRREEFSKRVVDDELASLIKEVLVNNALNYRQLRLNSPPLFYRKFIGKWGGKFYRQGHSEFYTSPDKKDFSHHLTPQSIYQRVAYITDYLPLSPRTGKPFHLAPYRFRYTVGTNAVMEGMTEEEVADLLDHSSTLCVKHYFRYTHEMWELLENATMKRTEQKHFTAAWSREEDLKNNIYGEDVIELHAFTAIGKCRKESACYLEPAVACYTCKEFCPNRDKTSHNNALTSLRERQQMVANNAPTSLSKQLDEAVAGCLAAIAYSQGDEVVNIYLRASDE